MDRSVNKRDSIIENHYFFFSFYNPRTSEVVSFLMFTLGNYFSNRHDLY